MNKESVKTVLLLLSVAGMWGSCKERSTPRATRTPRAAVQALYHNGDMLTMETSTPQYVEALVVDKGAIVFVGALQDAKERYTPRTTIDLKGKLLLPGFIDPHSHFSHVSNTMGQLDLNPPPVGDVKTIPQLLHKLRRYKIEHRIPDGEWIFANGYDDNQLQERRHPTSRELDSVLPRNLVYLSHTSGHMGVANSLALAKLGITAKTPNPKGGNIGRYPGTKEPNGLVQETAMYPFVGNMLRILNGKAAEFFGATQDLYAANGYTTSQDGMVDRNRIKFYQKCAREGKFKIDLIALAGSHDLQKNLQDPTISFKTYGNRFKVQGTKIIADGSPQGKTAFFTKPYLTLVPGCTKECRGLPSLDQSTLNHLFRTAYAHRVQLFVHCNGDASIDMLIAAHEHACKALHQPLNRDRRTVVIHSQFVRPDQLQTYVKYRILPSFFTNHAFFWGDVHVKNLGKERAHFLSPIASADRLGLRYTNHSDATVTPVNPMLGVWSAVNRLSRSGKVIGANERATPYQALRSITLNAAYEHFEEKQKGSLTVGKRADLVILEKNPLRVKPSEIKSIKIVQTIKEGKTIYLK